MFSLLAKVVPLVVWLVSVCADELPTFGAEFEHNRPSPFFPDTEAVPFFPAPAAVLPEPTTANPVTTTAKPVTTAAPQRIEAPTTPAPPPHVTIGMTVEWKYKMMQSVLVNAIVPVATDLNQQVEEFTYELCDTQDPGTLETKAYIAELNTAYVELLTRRESLLDNYQKQTNNVTEYLNKKFVQILTVDELLKDDKCIAIPDREKMLQKMLTSFEELMQSLDIYKAISGSLQQIEDFRHVIANNFEALLHGLLEMLNEVLAEGAQCSDSNPIPLHEPFIQNARALVEKTVEQMLSVLNFLAEDLEYSYMHFATTLRDLPGLQDTFSAAFDALEDRCLTTTPGTLWPVMFFGKLEAYRLVLDAINWNQPKTDDLEGQTFPGEDGDSQLEQLKGVLFNMEDFRMKLPDIRLRRTRRYRAPCYDDHC